MKKYGVRDEKDRQGQVRICLGKFDVLWYKETVRRCNEVIQGRRMADIQELSRPVWTRKLHEPEAMTSCCMYSQMA